MSRVEIQNNGVANSMRENRAGNFTMEKVIDDGAGENSFTWADRLLRSKSAKIGLSAAAAAAIFSGLVPGAAAASNTAIVEQGEMPSQKGGVLEQLEKAVANQETDGWPIMEGLNFKDGKYYYGKNNVYGGKEGELAGLVKPEVYVEGEKIGGVCFKPEVCKVMLENAYAKIPEGEPKLTDIVPLDISNYEESVKFYKGSYFSDYSKKNIYGVIIESLGDVAILNTRLEASWWSFSEITVNKGKTAKKIRDDIALVSDLIEYPEYAFSRAPGLMKAYVLISSDVSKGKEVNSGDVLFGEKIGYKGFDDVVCVTTRYGEVEEKWGIPKTEDFLTVGNKIVFMIPYETITVLDGNRAMYDQQNFYSKEEVATSQTIKEMVVGETEYKTISAGYTGPEVAVLKQRMYDLGYFKSNTVNESFTDKTAEYVKEFEKVNGLPIDGVADSEMLKLFYSDKAIPKPK